MVLILGDLVSHDDWNLEEEDRAEVNKFVLDSIKKTFSDPNNANNPVILPVVGNHEGDPLNYENYDDPENYIYTNIFPAFGQFISAKQMGDLKKKGFYTELVGNLKFLCFDSNINSAFNSHSVAHDTNPKGLLQPLAEEFYDSEKKGQKVIIVTHIPFADESAKTQFPRFVKVLFERFADTISASFAAHTHNDHFKFYKNLKGENMFVEYISPSLTTFQNLNPSYRVYEISPEGEVENYEQYRMNMDVMNVYASQDNFKLEFDLVYDLLTQYELAGSTEQGNFPVDFSLYNTDGLRLNLYRR